MSLEDMFWEAVFTCAVIGLFLAAVFGLGVGLHYLLFGSAW